MDETRAPLHGEPLPVELANTLWADRSTAHDALGTDAEAGAWLDAVRDRLPEGWPADARLTAADCADLRRLRDAVRRLAAEVTDDPRPPAPDAPTTSEAVATLEALAAAVTVWPGLTWGDGPRATTRYAGPAGAALVTLLAREAVALLTDERCGLLRACLAPGCVLFFAKDHGRREWCSAGCGGRARAARHYRRHRSGS